MSDNAMKAASGVLGLGDPHRRPGSELRLSCARIAADLHISDRMPHDDVVSTARDLYDFVKGNDGPA